MDTGLHRLGIPWDDTQSLTAPYSCSHLRVTGVFTHLADTERRDEEMCRRDSLTFDIPHVIRCVMPKLQQLDPNIYEAAQDLGAPGFLAFRKVILPEIMPGVINGLLLSLIHI